MLACYSTVPHGTLWSSYKSPRVILDCLLSDFREDVLSHPSEWKLCPLSSMLRAICSRDYPVHLPYLLPRVQSTQRKQEYYISIQGELKYVSCISFSLFRTSGHSDSQIQAQGLHHGFPLHPPQPNSSQFCKGLYIELRFQIIITDEPGYLQSILLTSLTPVFSCRKT